MKRGCIKEGLILIGSDDLFFERDLLLVRLGMLVRGGTGY
jgi:hypothetical protein